MVEMDGVCSFCSIIHGNAPAYRVFESEHILAILDILPRTSGHVLVIPKVHVPLLSELPDDIARDLGSTLTRVSRAMTQGLDNLGLTITLNQVYAQVVPHVCSDDYTITLTPRVQINIIKLIAVANRSTSTSFLRRTCNRKRQRKGFLLDRN